MRTLITLLLSICLTLPAIAEELAVGDGLILNLSPPAGWTLLTEPPEALIEETAEHVAHEAEALGKHPSAEQIRQIARKRLAANEALLYHAASGSHLAIDFSPLNADEEPPSSGLLKKSAQYAVESLSSEEGVTAVSHSIDRASVRGAEAAYRLDARYRHHDEAVSFIGVIGYARQHWFFLYFTAPGQDPVALREIEQVYSGLGLRVGSD